MIVMEPPVHIVFSVQGLTSIFPLKDHAHRHVLMVTIWILHIGNADNVIKVVGLLTIPVQPVQEEPLTIVIPVIQGPSSMGMDVEILAQTVIGVTLQRTLAKLVTAVQLVLISVVQLVQEERAIIVIHVIQDRSSISINVNLLVQMVSGVTQRRIHASLATAAPFHLIIVVLPV